MNVTADCSRHGRNPSHGGSPWDVAALLGIAPDKHIKAELHVDAGADVRSPSCCWSCHWPLLWSPPPHCCTLIVQSNIDAWTSHKTLLKDAKPSPAIMTGYLCNNENLMTLRTGSNSALKGEHKLLLFCIMFFSVTWWCASLKPHGSSLSLHWNRFPHRSVLSLPTNWPESGQEDVLGETMMELLSQTTAIPHCGAVE